MHALYRSPHYAVWVDDEKSLVRLVRSDQPFDDVEQLKLALSQLIAKLVTLKTNQLMLLTDLRQGPLRNNPAFEAASRPIADFAQNFKRHAVLVQTMLGQLQLKRLSREHQTQMNIFNDEAAALEFLMLRERSD
jgi:hypothetical protein